ncbi:serine hydrolase [Leptobacterium flavescens]|uniref:Serine hydrolase n=1 Tax=Leptobacterium flavescens TaxID=472055 RepID=A0A6P0UIM7_9FLAO|nr:serine hydrolase [Leptobacterium flavescens]NER13155.1 serine hydrolase [Leptobacterium flavescens]
MKKLKWILLILLAALGVGVILNYPKLNIISGYSAKNMSSSVFVAERSFDVIDSIDNGFAPVNIAADEIDLNGKSASASVYGFKKRTAVYREGLGSVLINDDFDPEKPYLKPRRSHENASLSYPYGDAEQQDTLFGNLDYTKLRTAVSNAFGTSNPNQQTRAVVVVYKDQIVAEQYASGFSKNTRILGWSMTKSIVSTLYGILQHQNRIDVQDPAPVDAWKNDERAGISLHNLLQMNSGLEWEEDYTKISDVTRMLFLEENMASVQERKKAKYEPNTHWNYSSGTTNLLSGILRKQFSSHQEYLDFAYSALLDKIGMHSSLIETDMAGNYVGSSYGWATPRDWAKFGLLYLHKGNWNGMQLFSPEWVDYVVQPTPTSEERYGAQFWLNAGGYLPDVPKSIYYADGYQGQRVFIIPSHDMVVVRMGLDTESYDFNGFLKEILAAVGKE